MRRLASMLLLAACAGTQAPPPAARARTAAPAPPPARLPDPPTLRLPDTVVPLRAALDLTLIPTEPRFSGTARYDVQLGAPAPVVWLNATGLELGAVSAEVGGGARAGRAVPGNADVVGLAFDPPLPAGPARLTVAWTGTLDSERSLGLYRVAEKDGAWYLYSFFEPIDARRAFPCFDDPSAKIPWTLTLHVPAGDVALGNAPVTRETDEGGGRKRVELAETRPLPSYLVALIVGPFEVVDGGTAGNHGTPLRFAIPRGRAAELRYALQVTPKIVGLLEDYFGMPYPYGKLDVAVVPRYWGTMEHPGLVALGQPLTLIKPDAESFERRLAYANIAIHELAHYWFGDYVTTAWWDDTWLNEAAASWMDIKITDALDPAFEERVARDARFDGAMRTDGLPSAKKIRQPVLGKDDIANAFDASITYSKGNAVISMFEAYVGPERWQRLIRAYLAAHAWGNATAEDFLAAVSAEAGAEIATGMRGFLDRPGVPVVTAALECPPGAPPRLTLAQAPWVPPGAPPAEEKVWTFPVCAHWGAGRTEGRACTLLAQARGELVLADAKRCPDWVMPNAGATGYYRVGYDPKLAAPLLRDAGQALPLLERVRLFADLGELVAAGRFPLRDALAAVPALAREPSRHLVRAALALTRTIRRDTLDAADRARFAHFVRASFGPRARALGLASRPGESDDVRAQRRELLELVGEAGEDHALRRDARALALRWIDDRKAMAPELAGTVLRLAALDGDRPLFDRMVAEARRVGDQHEREQLVWATGGFLDPALGRAALDLLASGAFDVRDAFPIVLVQMYLPETRDAAWAWAAEHLDQLNARLRPDEQMRLFQIAGVFCDAGYRAKVSAFLEPRAAKIAGAPRTLKNGLDRIDVCIAQRQLLAPEVKAFLRGY